LKWPGFRARLWCGSLSGKTVTGEQQEKVSGALIGAKGTGKKQSNMGDMLKVAAAAAAIPAGSECQGIER
jgi:hypothetical protein